MGGLERPKGETFICHILVLCLKGGPEFFLNDRREYPKNMNAIRLGPGNFFASKTFSPPPYPPPPT